MRRFTTIFMILGFLLWPHVPAARAEESVPSAIQAALTWLHGQQRADGSFGGTSVTSDAVYTLALLGEDSDGPAWTGSDGVSALDALEALAPGYVTRGAGEAGKVLRAAALAGANPRAFGGTDLIALIEAAYDPATGRYHPDYLYRHTLAVEGLLRAGRPVPVKAYEALVDAQLPDGNWFWSFDGAKGDVDTTGRVLTLLAGIARQPQAASFANAAAYLDAAQLTSAGWGVNPAPDPNPANANSTALAVGGLRAAGYNPNAPRFQQGGVGGLQALLGFQEPSGAFVYIQQPGREEVRLMATLEALMALAQRRPLYLPLVLRGGEARSDPHASRGEARSDPRASRSEHPQMRFDTTGRI